MQESKSVLQDVFDTISTGIFVVDVESLGGSEPEVITFRFVSTNPAYARMLSIPTASIVGLCPQECFPPDIAERFCRNYRRCLEQRQPISYEESFEFEDHSCTLLTTLFPTLELDGRISRIIGSSQDISEFRRVEAVSKPFNEEIETTDRKRAEEALSQEKELLSTLIKNAPIGIISTDEVGKILLVNPAFERICGYSYEELVGQIPPYPYWDLADLDKINEEFRLAMSGEKEQIELWFTRKNGERFLARLKPITIFDEQGNMLRHLATMEDITKYKQAEEELHKALETERELNELKSRFVAMVSHEYRTPLTTILSSAELLERYTDQFTEEKKLKHYRRIQTCVEALTQLVNDVLAISKIGAGKQEFNPSALDLDKFCRELVEERQLTTGNQHNLVFTSHSNCPLVEPGTASITSTYMDEKLLRYIIGNLLSNAIKYSPQGSQVKFDLACDQDQAILRIQDEGIGIPVKDQQHLFKSFHRGSNVGTISGTGLGLAIVKISVDLHGGQIAVESEVGVGTTFTVTLPLNNPVITDEKASAAEGVNSY
jgi:PAS domain S-box-containing protein